MHRVLQLQVLMESHDISGMTHQQAIDAGIIEPTHAVHIMCLEILGAKVSLMMTGCMS